MHDEISVAGLPALALGGRFGERPARKDLALLDAWLARGGSVIETAHSYVDGWAEQRIGAWLTDRRAHSEMRVITKIGHPRPDGSPTLDPDTLRDQARISRRRLGCDRVDVILLHRDDPRQPVSCFAECLCGLVEEGVAAAVGVSNWCLPRLAELRDQLDGTTGLFTASTQWSLARPCRCLYPGAIAADRGLLDWHAATATPLLAWSANARGWFAGTHIGGPFDSPANRRLRTCLRREAAELGVSPASLALARTLSAGVQVCAVIGAETDTELDEALLAAQLAREA